MNLMQWRLATYGWSYTPCNNTVSAVYNMTHYAEGDVKF